MSQMREQFDKSARELLKRFVLSDLPTIEELKSARDAGPEALAQLIAKRTPGQLTEIGVGAATPGLGDFLAVLLKCGLNPNVNSTQGWSAFKAAETHGPHSKVYQLLKAAAER